MILRTLPCLLIVQGISPIHISFRMIKSLSKRDACGDTWRLKTETSRSVRRLCVVIEREREREREREERESFGPDGVESVPGAIATGSVNVTMDRYVSCDPVAPGCPYRKYHPAFK